MYTCRLRVLLGLVLTLVAVCSVVHASRFENSAIGSADAAAKGARFERWRMQRSAAPPIRVAGIDSIILSTQSFSPNADSLLDTVELTFAVDIPTSLIVHVSSQGQADTLRVLSNERVTSPQTKSLLWDGKNTAGFVVADGTYDLVFTTVDPPQFPETNRRGVRVDTVSPHIDSVRVEPSVFTPTLAGSDQEVDIRFRITLSQPKDQVGADVLAGEDTLEVALVGDFGGDGFYRATCRDCLDDDKVADGVHKIEVFAFDEAGNVATVVDSVDKNVLGPAVSLLHPGAGDFAVQMADSITGKAEDRQAVASLDVSVSGSIDSTISLPARDGAGGQEHPFFLDVSQLFAAEGNYLLHFQAVDVHGVRDTSFTVTYTVDRTPPTRPILTPPPLPSVRSSDLTLTVAVDSTADSLLVRVNGGSPLRVEIQGPSLVLPLKLFRGPNLLQLNAIDRAKNISDTETAQVTVESSGGISAPERFPVGGAITIDVGDVVASGVQVRILAMDGSLVRVLEDPEDRFEYELLWDLTTPEGRRVRNGAYLLVVRVEREGGATERFRKMIAVIE